LTFHATDMNAIRSMLTNFTSRIHQIGTSF
jgi:hypothetical protein